LQTPATHESAPGAQFAHCAPFLPQAESAVPVTHWLPLQQPVGQVV
jgi:hypothetical protein